MLSRRLALGSSGLAVFGVLSGSVLGAAQKKGAYVKVPPGAKPPKEIQERMEKSKAFSERLRNAKSQEEHWQIMNEQTAWQRQRAVEDLKSQLGISDQEWSVVKPRLQTVYDLVRPVTRMGRDAAPKTEVEQRGRELQELLRDDSPPADQIKAKLAAFRAAKERATRELAAARESLRQIVTLRQEALLVLNGLLD